MKLNEAHMASLFENATEGILLTDQSGNIILTNPAAEKIFGYQAEELVGQPIEILIPDRFNHHHHQLREGFYHKPGNRSMGAGRDLFGRKKDGLDIPVEVSLSHYTQNDQLYVIAFIVDITQRKKIENDIIEQKKELEKVTEQIRRMNTQLEAKVEERTRILKEALHQLERSQQDLREALSKEKELNEIKSRFVSMASHEFRTPLSSVLSSASLLSKYVKSEEQDNRDKHIKRIKESVKHLNDLLEDFLSLGKLEEGKVEVKAELFNVKEFIEDVADELKGLLKKGQTLDCFHSGPSDFYTDKRLLKNILINVISNAIKFSEENRPVTISAEYERADLVITVKDQGIGISADDQLHMFSSFFRARNATNIQGTGLGLHIVKRYVDLLEGAISLKSELGEGTEIIIKLPALSPA